ncbi:MAG: hypothetical protein QM752_01845 [Gammaproteobacteria bacterium]
MSEEIDKKSSYAPSPDKQNFMQGRDGGPVLEATRLSAKDLKYLGVHFNKRKDLEDKLIINGSTELGQKMIKENKKSIKEAIKNLQNPKINIAYFLVYLWKKKPIKDPILSKYFSLLGKDVWVDNVNIEILKKIDQKNTFSEKDLEKINSLCNQPDKKICYISDRIKAFVEKLNNLHEDICLTKEQSLVEVQEIQKDLKEKKSKEPIGYVFTNEKAVGNAHFEPLILQADKIIKPMVWGPESYNPEEAHYAGVGYIYPQDIKCITYAPYLDDFCINKDDVVFQPSPQARDTGCGAFNVLWLKELLKKKEDGSKLLDFPNSLTFEYYDDASGKLKGFYFPSAKGFRYSQSNTYNRLMKDMLFTPAYQDVLAEHKESTDKYKSIETILQDTLKVAKSKGDHETLKRTQDVLEKLPEFRKTWLKHYEEAMVKRSAMEYTTKDRTFNAYLVYRSENLKKKAQKISEKASEENQPVLLEEKSAHTTPPENVTSIDDKTVKKSTNRLKKFGIFGIGIFSSGSLIADGIDSVYIANHSGALIVNNSDYIKYLSDMTKLIDLKRGYLIGGSEIFLGLAIIAMSVYFFHKNSNDEQNSVSARL